MVMFANNMLLRKLSKDKKKIELYLIPLIRICCLCPFYNVKKKQL